MEDKEKLFKSLNRINGRGYKAYLDLKGSYDFGFFTLFIDHVQRDPFASPSLFRVEVPEISFPHHLYENIERKVALEDYISRAFQGGIRRHSGYRTGSGKSGIIQIDSGSQEILQRSCVNIDNNSLEIRFQVGLPAKGRRILGKEAQKIILKVIPEIVSSCLYENLDYDMILRHVNGFEDAEYIRNQLKEEKLVTFIADGSILPRISGVSDKPLLNAVELRSPSSLQISLETLHQDTVTGMGLDEGVNLIVGGGYHGKSTLLRAVELGVYNHIFWRWAGDGDYQGRCS
ncbi:ABC-ATPase domain-containing protein [Methanobacterium petrolearium]|uniref:ABC-ATPase domain-containing protein n=1 Tax=Methanobacterium petrolearium TaxID=710190 RepID=UPI0024755781|nr:ABC-ATPase domain-containing protein [Methanobacterium petrolearium]MBP1945395.1 putative ABC-class ATPase [Methanobacterium petrolearium]BDZ71588.1 hypothetical protein GCM10025861_21050 [Methanobacterium petrolearium]